MRERIVDWILWSVVLIFACNVVGSATDSCAAIGYDLPEQAQLSADRMFFEAESGEFSASGNVVIQAEGVTFHAPHGTGNVKSKEVHFSGGITIYGDWRGNWLDLSAEQVSFFFSQTPTYIAEGTVRGVLGELYVDVDKFYMKGSDFSALNVRRFEDRELDFVFGAARVDGVVEDGILTTFTAEGSVWLNGRPNADGDVVNIKGDRAVYSAERGSVVLSGNVSAVQGGRTLTAGSLAYFPDSNRIDAFGAYGGPAIIVIDMSQEQQGGQE